MGRRVCRVAILRVGFLRVGLFLFLFLFFLFLFVFQYLTSADGRQEDEMIVSGTKIVQGVRSSCERRKFLFVSFFFFSFSIFIWFLLRFYFVFISFSFFQTPVLSMLRTAAVENASERRE